MSKSQSYKLGAFVFGVSACAMFIMLFLQYDSRFQSNISNRNLEDELRLHRQVFIDLKNSPDPQIPENVREECTNGIKDIDKILYKENLSQEDELYIRSRLHDVNNKIKSEYLK